MKLNEFKLETYDERFTLMCALEALRSREQVRDDSFYQKYHKPAVDALLLRISQTECQPGGCEYCNADRAAEAMERYDD